MMKHLRTVFIFDVIHSNFPGRYYETYVVTPYQFKAYTYQIAYGTIYNHLNFGR